MKTSLLNTLIVTAALSAVSGFAQAAPRSQYDDMANDTVSNTTRAAVKADYLKARADGTLVQLGGEDTFAKAPAVADLSQPAKTRAEVISDLRKTVFKHPVGEI